MYEQGGSEKHHHSSGAIHSGVGLADGDLDSEGNPVDQSDDHNSDGNEVDPAASGGGSSEDGFVGSDAGSDHGD